MENTIALRLGVSTCLLGEEELASEGLCGHICKSKSPSCACATTAEPATRDQPTIAAFITAVGGAVAVVRISGARAFAVAERVWHGCHPLAELPERQFHLGKVFDGESVVDGSVLAVAMRTPQTYTGEDTVELHGHGGALVARLVLQAVLRAGAQPAAPGEFTKRAFLNGRIDLTQAEAVNDLIRAQSEAALQVANRQLDGRLGHTVEHLHDTCRHRLAELEACLDFADPIEETGFAPQAIREPLCELRAELERLLASRLDGQVLREGVALVIAGPPNVGKSTLLNAILGRDRAIVSDVPGTTRDTLEEIAHIRDIPVRLVDTAGLREAADAVEALGVERSQNALRTAQIVLLVREDDRDASGKRSDTDLAHLLHEQASVIDVINKIDLSHDPAPAAFDGAKEPSVRLCAQSGAGLELLFDAIEQTVWQTTNHTVPDCAISERHARYLDEALSELNRALDALASGTEELAATALRGTLDALGAVIGRSIAADDILGDIFSKFCIGK